MPSGHVEMGHGTVADVMALLADRDVVSYRMVLVQPPRSSWRLHTLLVDALPDNDSALQRPAFSYDYRDVFALGGQMPGTTVNALLQQAGRQFHEFVDPVNQMQRHSFGMPKSPSGTAATGGLTWFRFSSRSRGSAPLLVWPHTRYELSLNQADALPGEQVPHHLLINEGCPFFPDVETLIANLIYETPPARLADAQLSDRTVTIRIADARSWLEEVDVSTSSVRVSVQGTDLRGVRLHISGDPALFREIDLQRAEYEELPEGGEKCTNTIPLTDDVPSVLTLLVAQGTEWRDYRAVSTQWSPFQASEAGVTVAQPDLAMQIAEYIYQGEGPRIEFKHQPPQNSDQKERILKTVAAFANGQGGVILIGVEDDSGTLVGIAKDNLPRGSISRLRDELRDLIRAQVVPGPEIDIQRCEIEHKPVLIINVNAGGQRPYGVKPDKPVFYVRRGATTFPARPDEVRALVSQPIAG